MTRTVMPPIKVTRITADGETRYALTHDSGDPTAGELEVSAAEFDQFWQALTGQPFTVHTDPDTGTEEWMLGNGYYGATEAQAVRTLMAQIEGFDMGWQAAVATLRRRLEERKQ